MASNYGFTALMESIQQSETAQKGNDKLKSLMEATVSDDVAAMVTGDDYSLEDDEDSVEKDMAGRGIGYEDEKKLKKLIATIPEDEDDDMEIDDDAISQVIESVLGDI